MEPGNGQKNTTSNPNLTSTSQPEIAGMDKHTTTPASVQNNQTTMDRAEELRQKIKQQMGKDDGKSKRLVTREAPKTNWSNADHGTGSSILSSNPSRKEPAKGGSIVSTDAEKQRSVTKADIQNLVAETKAASDAKSQSSLNDDGKSTRPTESNESKTGNQKRPDGNSSSAKGTSQSKPSLPKEKDTTKSPLRSIPVSHSKDEGSRGSKSNLALRPTSTLRISATPKRIESHNHNSHSAPRTEHPPTEAVIKTSSIDQSTSGRGIRHDSPAELERQVISQRDQPPMHHPRSAATHSHYFDDLDEWLELTGYHDVSYRRGAVRRHRALADLEEQRAKILEEDHMERGGRDYINRYSAAPRVDVSSARPKRDLSVSPTRHESMQGNKFPRTEQYRPPSLRSRMEYEIAEDRDGFPGPQDRRRSYRRSSPDDHYRRSDYYEPRGRVPSSPQASQAGGRGVDFEDTAFFMIKSSNHRNVTVSQNEGIWATQPHNVKVLEKAFRTKTNVMLVFSVNRSMAFQGYARMESLPGEAPMPSWASRLNWKCTPAFYIRWVAIASGIGTHFRLVGHLKNLYNEDQTVIVGRDGQEIEEGCGKKLCKLLDIEARGWKS